MAMKVLIEFNQTSGIFKLTIGNNIKKQYNTNDYQVFTEGNKVGIRSNDEANSIILTPTYYKDWNDGTYNNIVDLLDFLYTNFKPLSSSSGASADYIRATVISDPDGIFGNSNNYIILRAYE